MSLTPEERGRAREQSSQPPAHPAGRARSAAAEVERLQGTAQRREGALHRGGQQKPSVKPVHPRLAPPIKLLTAPPPPARHCRRSSSRSRNWPRPPPSPHTTTAINKLRGARAGPGTASPVAPTPAATMPAARRASPIRSDTAGSPTPANPDLNQCPKNPPVPGPPVRAAGRRTAGLPPTPGQHALRMPAPAGRPGADIHGSAAHPGAPGPTTRPAACSGAPRVSGAGGVLLWYVAQGRTDLAMQTWKLRHRDRRRQLVSLQQAGCVMLAWPSVPSGRSRAVVGTHRPGTGSFSTTVWRARGSSCCSVPQSVTDRSPA